MAVPFAKPLTALAAEDRKEREVREVLYKFAKSIDRKNAYSIMRDYDDRMQELPLSSAADTFMGCLPDSRMSADLYVSSSKPTLLQLLESDYTKCKPILAIFSKLAKSAQAGGTAIVLFTVSKVGLYVATNMSMRYSSLPRIVIHASSSGVDEVQFMPLATFEQEYALNFN